MTVWTSHDTKESNDIFFLFFPGKFPFQRIPEDIKGVDEIYFLLSNVFILRKLNIV